MTLPAWAKGALLLAITLSAGIAIGVGYERRRAPAHEASAVQSHDILHRITHELELDSAQREAIDAILARRQGTVDSTWHVMRPHVRATLDSTLDEIAALLRSDQVARYREMIEARHPRTPR